MTDLSKAIDRAKKLPVADITVSAGGGEQIGSHSMPLVAAKELEGDALVMVRKAQVERVKSKLEKVNKDEKVFVTNILYVIIGSCFGGFLSGFGIDDAFSDWRGPLYFVFLPIIASITAMFLWKTSSSESRQMNYIIDELREEVKNLDSGEKNEKEI